MDRKYFDELARVLFQQGIRAELKQDDNLTILLDGQTACHVSASSQMYVAPGDMRTLEADELYHRTAPIAETVRKYMTAIEKAPLLKARDLDEDFRLLAEFNGIVLAGQETEKGYGYKFVTWQRDYDGTGVGQGHYYIDNYNDAKQDFAVRAGLVQKQRIFTDAQLLEIYQCVNDTFEVGYELTQEDAKKLSGIQKQIEALIPDVNEQIAALQQKASEAILNQSM